jgi:Cu/Ag efflux protein CusF
MRKWTMTLAAAAMTLGLTASTWACNTSNGEVLQINADNRTVAMTKGGSCESSKAANSMVFKLKKETKILINGKEASLADLKAGDKVKVDYEQLDDVLKISVTRDS